ncbi:hypothetical protein DPMN_025904 [Dreissena polymorpha]|uniref:Uncharacterized protein n=1 Tax=Dreissena polymorpha TaxID=45954 RepID=A0A9D4LS83_DREPO|nr:hypothetical protein DPMN_025904 [Dreissena polymorpha]
MTLSKFFCIHCIALWSISIPCIVCVALQSEESERELTRLLCEVKEASSEFHVESTEYLNMLMSHDSEIKQYVPQHAHVT